MIRSKLNIMFAANNSACSETTPLIGGSYMVTYYRNASGACRKEDATEAIVHYHKTDGTLVHCEYHKIESAVKH
ncbi:MAG TPA: hypothetical protein IAB25_06180 [Candidatus Coproplasma stercoravium]|nr:hypothetical protein [Candidatus Coproplasma stercoravium]